jgi:hypothetical protein
MMPTQLGPADLPKAGDDGNQRGEVDARFLGRADRQANPGHEGARGFSIGVANFVGDEKDDDGKQVKQYFFHYRVGRSDGLKFGWMLILL